MFIKEGVPTLKTNGITPDMVDPYQYYSDEVRDASKALFNSIYTEYNSTESNTCINDLC